MPADRTAGGAASEVVAEVPDGPYVPRDIARALLDAVRVLGKFAAGPLAPDAEVRAWKLYTGAEYGGVYCAQPRCGCAAENSEIIHGAYGDEPEGEEPTYTLDELHEAIAEHIAHRAELRAEEADEIDGGADATR
jgi:hypothetical protein